MIKKSLTPNISVKIKGKNVLVAPLDWGLGHTTRCIPIINALIINHYHVILAASGKSAALLQKEFPHLTIVPLAGYHVQYAQSSTWLPVKLLLQVPKIIRAIKNEHAVLHEMVQQYSIDWVISDNRFGLYHPAVHCTFITHQLTIMAPYQWLRNLLQRINYQYINRFDTCWVPDMGGDEGLAGILSHPKQLPAIPVQYMGMLSRFESTTTFHPEYVYDYCFLLSGPEPQRTRLENIVLSQIEQIDASIIVLRGLPEQANAIKSKHNILSHLPGKALQQVIEQSKFVIARSGYTTVMELLSLQKKCFFIPTPGQTEQEYLAERLADLQLCFMVKQEHLNIAEQLTALEQFPFKTLQPKIFTAQQLKLLIQNL
ncbi:MAG: glycosyltransferase [Hydrotalea flava]|uniref:glycosyltransferase n=1 Tax=Hydrotalea flava TaxID=714549 RepID=UPI00082AD073|nr:glycosyltransferase [Hydrotalea flava]NIT20352.1 glycosyltransferase [Hydrotalea flava]RTL49830.1 MAG: glycosyltransferase [Sphingobacteriales bacterium]